MTWTNHLVVCLVVIHSCSIICGTATIEELLQEKEDYRQEVDRLFYVYHSRETSDQHEHGDTNTNEGRRLQPLPSPDWSTHSATSDDVYEEDLEASQATLFDDENYRPRVEASGGAVREDDLENTSEDVFSGDSGVFIKERPITDYDENDLNFPIEYPLVLQEITTVAPSVPIIADKHECEESLKIEINSCIEMALYVMAILHEMENSVDESGYYNVSSMSYFAELFRPCVSNKVTRLQSCVAVRVVDIIVDEVKQGIITFAHRNEDGYQPWTTAEQMYFECLHQHLNLLDACLRTNLTNERIEGVVKMVLVGVDDVKMVRQCLDLKGLQQCVVETMLDDCDDSSATRLVDAMFEEATSCVTPSGNGADVNVTSQGVITLALGILALFFHKQTHNHR